EIKITDFVQSVSLEQRAEEWANKAAVMLQKTKLDDDVRKSRSAEACIKLEQSGYGMEKVVEFYEVFAK
ncbi:MAG: hypothetical protein IJU50_06055, partial [Lachnospiraceae bacterium]|nr:hypothetical protein [Lachnospiraceae bacterium]